MGAEKMVAARGGFEDDEQWHWVSEIHDTETPGLVSLSVTVSRIDADRINNVSYSLQKLVRVSKPTGGQDRLTAAVGRN